MSEALKFPSKDLKGWLERETGSVFIPVHSKAQKLLGGMRKSVEDLVEVSRMLLDNSAKEIEKRNMRIYGRARALNKLARLFVDRTRQIKIPEKISYDSLNKFVEDTQKAFSVTDADVRNWFPRVSPFFILDRRKFLAVFERAKLTLRELNNFLARDYVKTKTLEETFQLIDKLLALEMQLGNLGQERAKTESQKTSVEKEISGTQGKIVDLRGRGGISQLSQTNSEIEDLCVEVKHGLRYLQKPFIKLQSLATHGEGSGLTPEELSKLNQYLENPFEAFSTEAAGHPLLRHILRKLELSISQGKLKLKAEKVRKAEQTIEEIASKNSLASLHQKCTDAIARRARLSSSEEVTAKQQDLLNLQEQLEDLKRRREIVETEEFSIKRAYDETREKIRSHKDEIEKNILSFMGKTVRVE